MLPLASRWWNNGEEANGQRAEIKEGSGTHLRRGRGIKWTLTPLIFTISFP